jgi:peroxiredoxin Q/BCP
MLQAYGAWRMKKFMGRSFEGIVRSTFLIGTDGKLQAVWDAVKVKGHVAEVLAAASVM